jgi:hypothetical protein
MRDAGAVTFHRIRYEGPPSFAVRAATLLADAEGVELKSAGEPERSEDESGTVLLRLTVEGTVGAVTAAVDQIGSGLAPEAKITIE